VAEGGGQGGARQEGSNDVGETHCVLCGVSLVGDMNLKMPAP
jgi:hypothetical protein